ncbi:peptidase S11 D-alanyl-D-alanine carboxypeptidase 1 domain protein [Desulfosporosinus sp. OT]|nr:peptidase S11 D-alanyl-D-alanine carboxypeptidase 1 domain protein [Desulfosporosinus sp. OT]EGW40847.1 peptidase S11 D-alanyl-D-alanine carboxypeptidase 1 domain protein [Desulfosporosinus sp. OT]
MLPSGDNIADKLGRWVSGSDAAFVVKMNKTAKELGMTNTNYSDASGVSSATVSNAVDQMKIAQAAMENPVFREIVARLPFLVTVFWYKGDAEGFIQTSSKMKTVAPHKLNNTLVWLNGKRAVAVCMACIQTRKEIEGVSMDLSSYVRLVYTAFKDADIWKIASMDAIYEKDSLVPVSPASVHPSNTCRSSYMLLTSMIGSEGYAIDQELPGDDCPELSDALLSKVEGWLANVYKLP